MQSELLNCPFCGGDPTPDFSSIIGEDNYHFHCQSGGCHAWPNVSGATEAEAIAAWNTRASDAEIARLTEALRLQMEAKHKEAAEAKLWFSKAQEWKVELRAAEEREKALREAGNPFVFAVTHCKAIGKRPHDLVLTSEFEALAAALKEQPHADA